MTKTLGCTTTTKHGQGTILALDPSLQSPLPHQASFATKQGKDQEPLEPKAHLAGSSAAESVLSMSSMILPASNSVPITSSILLLSWQPAQSLESLENTLVPSGIEEPSAELAAAAQPCMPGGNPSPVLCSCSNSACSASWPRCACDWPPITAADSAGLVLSSAGSAGCW